MATRRRPVVGGPGRGVVDLILDQLRNLLPLDYPLS